MKPTEILHWLVAGHRHSPKESKVLAPAWVAHGAPYLVEAEQCECGYLRVPGDVWRKRRG